VELGAGFMIMVIAGTGPLWVDAIEWRAVDWGNAAEWVGGVGASAAFIAGAVEYRQRGLDARSAQATGVHGWAEPVRELAATPTAVRAWIGNTSKEPVYQVVVEVYLLYTSFPLQADRIPERVPREWVVLRDYMDVLPPETKALEWRIPSYVGALRGLRPASATEIEGFDVYTVLIFRDAKNIWWERGWDGQLRHAERIGTRAVLAEIAPQCLDRPELVLETTETLARHRTHAGDHPA
jgi:hypothetical protein